MFRKNYYAKMVLGSCALVFSTALLVHTKDTAVQFKSDEDLVQHAIENMKEELQNKKGKAHIISCTYEIDGETPVSSRTKIYFTDYHKQPESGEKIVFGDKSDTSKVSRVVEIIYNSSDKKYVSIVDRNPRKTSKRLASKKVKVPAQFCV